MNQILEEARTLLATVTPLQRDCGRVCGAACCSSLEGEETGMLLFPGEEECYRALPDWKTVETERGTLLFCPGTCCRENRPLACRLFPLLPLPEAEGIRVAVDLRARAVCPLARQGKNAMLPAFRKAVQEAGEILLRDPEQARTLQILREEQLELKQLRKEWLG